MYTHLNGTSVYEELYRDSRDLSPFARVHHVHHVHRVHSIRRPLACVDGESADRLRGVRGSNNEHPSDMITFTCVSTYPGFEPTCLGEELEANATLFRWVAQLDPIFDEHEVLIRTSREKAEMALKEKRVEFNATLAQLETTVAEYKECVGVVAYKACVGVAAYNAYMGVAVYTACGGVAAYKECMGVTVYKACGGVSLNAV